MLIPSYLSIIIWLLAPACGLALSIDKLVLFPTAGSVRVQVMLRSDAAVAGLPIRGRIAPVKGGPALWEGTLGTTALEAGKPTLLEKTVAGLKPELWSPGSPTLYEFTLTAEPKGTAKVSKTVRTGFRSVGSRGGQILLDGRPIFLCGLAINPPGRGVPENTGYDPKFAHDYVKFMRSQNFNCIRINLDFASDPRSQPWFDACDELGMMVYQGCYGSPPEGVGATHGDKTDPPDNLDASVAAYRDVFETYAAHPSIIIYVLSNELPYGEKSPGPEWHRFLTAAHQKLKAWDSTRLYIGNAGYGEGKEGDINDVHRYWGWYYNSFLTYYNLRRTQDLYGEKGAVQPFTFSECVGSFTSTLGEFNLTFRKQLGAALEWTGHSSEQAKDALAYQAFMAGHACESFRTMREVNPRLAGLMPFTILYYNWNGITSFDQMKAKPVVDAMARAYRPVLLSWEMWTPQVYAGQKLHAFAHVVNDAEDFSDLKDSSLDFSLASVSAESTKSTESITQPIPTVPYFGHHKLSVSYDIPASTSGDFMLNGSIVEKNTTVGANQVPVFVADEKWRTQFPHPDPNVPIMLYDPSGRTAKALADQGIQTQKVADLSSAGPLWPASASLATEGQRYNSGGLKELPRLLIVGEEAAADQDLSWFVRAGGRVLLLAQDYKKFKPDWLPAQVEMLTGSANDPTYLKRLRPTRDGMNINLERPDHPAFSGLDRSRFHLWSDYTGWDQTKPGFPAVYPVTHGFRLTRAEDLDHVAVLANYDRGLEGVALCEMFDNSDSGPSADRGPASPTAGNRSAGPSHEGPRSAGPDHARLGGWPANRGSVIFTSLGLVSRAGLDPVADRMLANLVAYLCNGSPSKLQAPTRQGGQAQGGRYKNKADETPGDSSVSTHPIYPLIDAPIVWGQYETEKGLITSPLNGLVDNCRWVVPPTAPHAKPLADNTGEWNTKPGEQFVPIGRRPYGPYAYNNGSAPIELPAGAEHGHLATASRQGGPDRQTSGLKPEPQDDPDVQGDAAAAAARRAAERAHATARSKRGTSPRAALSKTARAATPRVDLGTGFFHAALPPGRQAMVTQIQNPTKEELEITISLNGREQSVTVPPGQTISTRSDLTGDTTVAHVTFTGDKRLVLLRTTFE